MNRVVIVALSVVALVGVLLIVAGAGVINTFELYLPLNVPILLLGVLLLVGAAVALALRLRRPAR